MALSYTICYPVYTRTTYSQIMRFANVFFTIIVLTFFGVGIHGRPQVSDDVVVIGILHFV